MNKPHIIPLLIGGAIAGIFIGTTIELIVSYSSGTSYSPGVPSYLEQFDNENTGVLMERLVYAALGAVSNVASCLLFTSEKLSIAAASIAHAMIVLTSLVVAAVTLHWVEPGRGLILFVPLAALIYAANWVVQYFAMRSKVKETNTKLAERNAKTPAQ